MRKSKMICESSEICSIKSLTSTVAEKAGCQEGLCSSKTKLTESYNHSMLLPIDRNLSWIPLSFSSQGRQDRELHTSHRTRECFPVSSSLDVSWLHLITKPTHMSPPPRLLLAYSFLLLSSFLEGQVCRCRQEGLAVSKEGGVVEDKGSLLQFWWKQGRGRISRYRIPPLLRNVR